MTMDKTSSISFLITLGLHTGLLLAFGRLQLAMQPTAEMPMLIEVTLAGSSAPRSTEEGVKTEGQVIAPRSEDEAGSPALTAQEISAWREKRRREIIKELSRDRTGRNIGSSVKDLRRSSEGLAAGRGAGEWGTPGSAKGTLSLTGEIAARGYKEPDFAELKGMITEETRLRLTLVVLPAGEVKNALLLETSGYPFVDQKAIELARKIIFDPLPPDWKQVEQQGVLTIKLKL
ncbi:TonB family protein [candidate division FCPU426 bacterium]|nr:TonB family protein [candidate division FCPU426 bacterium]